MRRRVHEDFLLYLHPVAVYLILDWPILRVVGNAFASIRIIRRSILDIRHSNHVRGVGLRASGFT